MSRQSWLITGVSSGFGAELARRLLADGDRVAGTVRKIDAAKELQAAYTDTFRPYVADVTDVEALRAAVDYAFADAGRIDVVVSNAGYGLTGAAEELSDEQIDRQIATNLTGSIQFGRAVIPHLRKQGGGRIVQLSSGGGQATFPGVSLYHATKWGIEGFWESTAQEIEAFGIDVLLVEPGGARTDFNGRSGDAGTPLAAYDDTPYGKMRAEGQWSTPPGDPGRMADAMIAAARSDAPPRRLVLGSDSYTAVSGALEARLAEVTSQKESASLTDADDDSETGGGDA